MKAFRSRKMSPGFAFSVFCIGIFSMIPFAQAQQGLSPAFRNGAKQRVEEQRNKTQAKAIDLAIEQLQSWRTQFLGDDKESIESFRRIYEDRLAAQVEAIYRVTLEQDPEKILSALKEAKADAQSMGNLGLISKINLLIELATNDPNGLKNELTAAKSREQISHYMRSFDRKLKDAGNSITKMLIGEEEELREISRLMELHLGDHDLGPFNTGFPINYLLDAGLSVFWLVTLPVNFLVDDIVLPLFNEMKDSETPIHGQEGKGRNPPSPLEENQEKNTPIEGQEGKGRRPDQPKEPGYAQNIDSEILWIWFDLSPP